jgi:hypothetical protein
MNPAVCVKFSTLLHMHVKHSDLIYYTNIYNHQYKNIIVTLSRDVFAFFIIFKN